MSDEEQAEDFSIRTCPYENCGKKFKRKAAYENHLNLHKKSDVIDKSVSKKINAKDKREEHKFVCQVCESCYNYEKSYLKHLQLHQIYICFHCKEEFTYPNELEEHMKSNHKKKSRKKLVPERELKCDTCNIEFPSLDELSSHNKQYHELIGDPCHICGKYLKRGSMRNHLEKVHNSEESRKYTCPECGKKYKTKTDLDTHFTKHTGDKQYTCPTCGKSYRFWNGLDNCLRKHEVRVR